MLSSSSFFYWILFITSQAFLLIPQTWAHISQLLISDDFISMTNDFVFVFVLIIIISLLVLFLANMKVNILEKSLYSISHEFLYISLFLHFIYFCISSKYIFLINFCFSVFLSSSVFILSLTLTLFLYHYHHHGNITITITDIIIIIIIIILLTLQSSVTFSFFHQYYHTHYQLTE